jgi:hypothetical protein
MKQRELRDKVLAVQDAALNALCRIEAVAGLMESAAGSGDSTPPLGAREIEEAAGIICEETTKVRDALSLMRGLVNLAKANR